MASTQKQATQRMTKQLLRSCSAWCIASLNAEYAVNSLSFSSQSVMSSNHPWHEAHRGCQGRNCLLRRLPKLGGTWFGDLIHPLGAIKFAQHLQLNSIQSQALL